MKTLLLLLPSEGLNVAAYAHSSTRAAALPVYLKRPRAGLLRTVREPL